MHVHQYYTMWKLNLSYEEKCLVCVYIKASYTKGKLYYWNCSKWYAWCVCVYVWTAGMWRIARFKAGIGFITNTFITW